jgi:hypothetical protein
MGVGVARIHRQISLRIRVTPTQQFKEALDRLDRLADDPSVLALAMRAAITESLFAAYQERFNRARKTMSTMYKGDASGAVHEPAESLEQALKQAGKTLDKVSLQYGYDSAAAERVKEMINRLTNKWAMKHGMDDKAIEQGGSTYSVGENQKMVLGGFGRFSAAMDKVRTDFLAKGQTGLTGEREGSQMTFGFGEIAVLDTIQTPSWNEKKTQPWGILWRQLEFGTGIYSKGEWKTVTGPTQAQAGGDWWYGPKRGVGIHLAGSRPGNFLRNSTGMHYDSQALRFSDAVAQHLDRALRGA